MTTNQYPHTIDNGAGESITFLRLVADGKRLELENCVQPGSGPPMHIHHYQEEALTVRQGRIGFQRPGEAAQFGGTGETVTFKTGEPHRFWNAGEAELKCFGYVEPVDNIEYYLTELYASTKRNGGRRPDPFDAAFLVHRYRSEFTMVAIPSFVRQFVFPIQIALGRMLGKYRKYENAPEPVKR